MIGRQWQVLEGDGIRLRGSDDAEGGRGVDERECHGLIPSVAEELGIGVLPMTATYTMNGFRPI